MKVLVIKTSALGDIIHALPVAEWIDQAFPSSQIDWVVEKPFAELVEAHPRIHRVLHVDTKKWRRGRELKTYREFKKSLRTETYDVVFDLQGNVKSGLLAYLAKSPVKAGFGWKTVAEWPNLLFTNWKANPPSGKNIRCDYLSLIQKYFGFFSDAPQNFEWKLLPEQEKQVNCILAHPCLQHGSKVMVCPGSSWKNKQMTASSLVAFLKHLQKEMGCCYLFIWGNEGEKKKADMIAGRFEGSSLIVDKMPLLTLRHLMSRLDLVISMDSLPLHLAGTTSTPTFSVFGPSSAEKYRPLGTHHTSCQGICPYQQRFEKRCPKLRTCSTGACIRSLNGDDVYEAFKT